MMMSTGLSLALWFSPPRNLIEKTQAQEEKEEEPVNEVSDGMQGATVVLTGLTGSHQAPKFLG